MNRRVLAALVLFVFISTSSSAAMRESLVAVSNTPGTASALAEVATARGRTLLAWVEGESEVRLRVSTDRGRTFLGEGRVIATVPRGERIYALRMVALNDLVYVMMTSGVIPELAQVSILRSADGGATFEQTRVDRRGGSPGADIALEARGALHLVVEDRGATGEIFHLVSEGKTFRETSLGKGTAPRIAVSGKRVAVVWSHEGEIYLSEANGEAARNISRSGGKSSAPAVAYSDEIHVVWCEGEALAYRRGEKRAVLATGRVEAPRIAVSGSAMRVSWNEATGSGRIEGPFLRRSSDGGATFGKAENVAETLEGEPFGGAAIVAASADLIAWPHTRTGLEKDADVVLIAAANALPCGVHWKDPVSGSWTDASKWSTNAVPGPGEIVCITADGNYTVTAPGIRRLDALQVGSAANVLGQPTLIVQQSLEATGQVINDGTITLDDPSSGSVTMVTTLFTNNAGANFNVVNSTGTSGGRVINGDVTNDGNFLVDDLLTLQKPIAQVVNRGTMTVSAGKELRPGSNLRFQQNAGLLRVLGKFEFSSSFTDADIIYFNGGDIEGTISIFGAAHFYFGANATGKATFEVTSGPAVMGGNVSPGQTVRVLARNTGTAGTMLTTPGSFSNGGTILVDSQSGSNHSVELRIDNGGVMTNSGRLEIGNVSLNSTKIIRGSVHNTAAGVIEIRDDAFLTGTNNVFTNDGSFTTSPGTRIELGVATIVNQNGGTFNVGGVFDLQTGGNQGPDTFNFNGGAITGEISMSQSARLNIGPGSTGAGRFVFHRGQTGLGARPAFASGKVAAAQEIVLRAEANVGISVEFSNVENDGLIVLESVAGSTYATEIIALTPIVNRGELQLRSHGVADQVTSRRSIRGSVTNAGIIQIDENAQLTGTSNVIINSGTLNIAAGKKVVSGNGTHYRQDAGSLNIEGTLWLEAGSNQGADVFFFNGGEVNGSVFINQFCGLAIGPNSTGPGTFVFGVGTIAFVGGGTISGNIAPAQTVILRGQDVNGGGASVTAATGFTNAGNLIFDSIGTTSSASGQLVIADGTLINTGTVTVTGNNPATGYSLTGHLDNRGVINVQNDLTFAGTNKTLTNSGAMNVLAGKLAFGNTFVFNQQAGTLHVGGGQVEFSTGGNQGFDTFNFNGGDVAGEVTLLQSSRLNIGPNATGRGRFVFGPTDNFPPAQITGNIAAGQTVLLRASASVGVSVSAPDSFSNSGTLLLDTVAGSTAGVTLTIGGGATLTNRGVLTIGGTSLGANKVVNAQITNSGRIEVLDAWSLTRTGSVYRNDGVVHIAPGQTLTLGGTSLFVNNPPAAFEGGGTLSIASGSDFAGAGTLGVNVTNAGRVRSVSSPSILDISGAYVQTSTGTLEVEIGTNAAGRFDQRNIGGSATLAGTLRAVMLAGACPSGDYAILTYASVAGDFGTKALNAGPGRTFSTVVGPNAYLLRTNGPPCNTPPVAADDAYDAIAGQLLDIAAPGLLGNDHDGENDPLTAVLVNAPSHGSVTVNANGSFTYTQGAAYVPRDSFTYKAHDGLVDSNVATVTITIIDAAPPVTAASLSPEPNANGWNSTDVTVRLTASDTASGVHDIRYRLDGGALVTTAAAEVSLLVGSEGIHTLEFFATDAAGNAEAAQTLVVRIDETAPVITAPAAVARPTDADACAATIPDSALGEAAATDNLTSVVVTRAGVPPNNLFPAGSTTLTYTATDLAGNAATATQTVTVSDETAPSVNAPAAIVVNAADNACSAVVSDDALGTASATDACGEPAVARSGVPAGNLFPLGTTTITYTATDTSGNRSSATQLVTVIDATAPAVSCPMNIEVNAPPGSCSATVDVGAATASDACPGVAVAGARSDGQALGAPYPLGVTTITWTAVDAAGNTSACQQTVTVRDATAPVISNVSANPPVVPPDGATVEVTIAYDLSEECGTAVAVLSGEGVEVIDAHRVRIVADVERVYAIVITATDAAGNSSTESVAVTVRELVPTPCTLLRRIETDLNAIIATNPPAADRLQAALAKVRSATAKACRVPPDRLGAAADIEGAARDLEGIVDPALLDRLATVARMLAVEEIDVAIARGGNRGLITAAQNFVRQADSFRARNRFTQACGWYRDAIAKALAA